jgi:hypothetical protein
MKLTASLLLLSSTLLAPTAVAQESDSEVAASWTEQGVCAYFYEKPGAWKTLAETCVKYCENNGGHGYSECDHTPYAGMDLPNGVDQSTISQDDTGDVYVPCLCKCDNPDVEGIVTAIVDIVIEGLSHLDEIICGVFMTAMVSAVPLRGYGLGYSSDLYSHPLGICCRNRYRSYPRWCGSYCSSQSCPRRQVVHRECARRRRFHGQLGR